MNLSEWPRVTRIRPCPICKKPDWCRWGPDGSQVLCARILSPNKVGNNGAGWIHTLDANAERFAKYETKPTIEWRPSINWIKLQAYYERMIADRKQLAESLGVSDTSLWSLRVGWSRNDRAYTFPMRDGHNAIIGMRTRKPSGEKKSVAGSRNGIFIPQLAPLDTLWVCEGPTDCAALLTLGKFAIGRPSNTGGMLHVLNYLTSHRDIKRLVILADRDAKPIAAKLTMQAAKELASSAKSKCRSVKIIKPPLGVKDIREWVRNGATSAMLDCIAKDAMEFNP